MAPFAGRNETQAIAASYLRHDGSWTFDVQLEAMLQAFETRTWFMGALSWAYSMEDAPLVVPSDGLRARAAEAILAKYYNRYAGGR